MATIVYSADIDTGIHYEAPTTNYGASTTQSLTGFDGANMRRMLLKLALTPAPPVNAILQSAVLSVYNETAGGSQADCDLYRILRAWSESQATWNVFTTGNNWGTAGCSNTSSDRSANSMGTLSILNAGWKTANLDLTEFRLMMAANNGLLIQMTPAYGKTVRTSEYASYVPFITVTYELLQASPAYLSDFGVI